MLRVVFITALVALATAAPPTGNERDRPLYTVEEKGENYELRRYAPALWVSTRYEARSDADAATEGKAAFWKLFNYISNENENDEKISMTAPVVTEIEMEDCIVCAKKYVRSFYLPTAHQENAPRPTNEDVFLNRRPEMLVYVTWFSGFASSEDYHDHAVKVADLIGEEQLDTSMYFKAGYDAPFKLFNRHNESWMKAKSS